MASTKDYANLSKGVYTLAPKVGNWDLHERIDRVSTGFKAGVYVNKDTGEKVIAIAGSDDIMDWINNIQAGIGSVPLQAVEAKDFYEQIRTTYEHEGDKITVTGHSAGGMYAAYIGALYPVDYCNFGSPSIGDMPWVGPNPDPNFRGNGKEFKIKGDPISEIGTPTGDVEWFSPEIDYASNPDLGLSDFWAKAHSMDQYTGEGGVKYDTNGQPINADFPAGEGIGEFWDDFISQLKGIFPSDWPDFPFPFDPFGMPKDEDPNNPIDVARNISPIILDLNKNGINTSRVDGSVYFDHDANGFAENTGWVGGGDGLLVMDRDGNGLIDSGRELFGDQTILANGRRAINGFQALAEFDTNRDGKIDANDAAWSQLRVWVDNGNGNTDDGELKTLDELGIKNMC